MLASARQYRNKKAHRSRKLLLILLVAAIFAIGAAIYLLGSRAPAEAPAPSTPANTTTATLSAAGDITMSDALLADALQPDGSYDFSSCFLNVAPLLSSSDLTVGNLELTFSGEPYGGTTFSAPESLADTLNTFGFDILQTANSKSLAGGLSGLSATLDVLRANNLEPLGTYASRSARSASGCVLLKEVNGIRIAFFAFTKGFDGMSIPAGSEYCANVLYKDYDTAYQKIATDDVLAVIQEAQALNPDVIIAMVHWGSEYKMSLSESQKDAADLMLKNGVDVILGSHSHMVGPMETRTVTRADGSEKNAFIAYSLGNLLASDTEPYTQASVVLNLEFTKNLDTGETTITKSEYIPVYLADYGEDAANRFQTLDIQQALALYESSYLGKVSEETYNAMQEALEDLGKNTVLPPEPEEDDAETK